MVNKFHLFTTLVFGISEVLGRQIPVVDGVLGGIPKSKTPSPSAFAQLTTNFTATPGKLRVTENSGICGGSKFS